MMYVLKVLISMSFLCLEWLIICRLEPVYKKCLRVAAAPATVYLAIAAAFINGKVGDSIYGSIYFATIIFTALCDFYTTEVYDWSWGIAGVTGIGILFYRGTAREVFFQLLIFIALQALLFRKFYGGADCMAFSVSAIYLCSREKGIYDYLVVMLLTFAVLAVVQLIKNNINRKGNLKKPVALIPYIAVVMLFMEVKEWFTQFAVQNINR